MKNHTPAEPLFPTARFGKDYLSASLQSILQTPVREVACEPLPGDASDRKYFRVSFQKSKENSGPDSLMVMQLREPHPDPENDFIRLLKFLSRLDLPVPELFFYDQSLGLLFLEDCGPTTLEDRVREHPEQTAACYREAVELLARLQARATREAGPDCPAFHLRFDVEKLMWEFDFMLEHYVGGLNKQSLSEGECREIRRRFQPLCETLAARKLCFTHRDYHSRNLMVTRTGLVILDFQDARMGPSQYDLVSLLKDSYVRLDSPLRNEMIELFIGLKEEEEGESVDRQDFYKIFDWMSIQRNLKAVGTFAFQSAVNGNNRYLEYIPPTLDYVRQDLEKNSDLAPLRDILMKRLPGLNPGETKPPLSPLPC